MGQIKTDFENWVHDEHPMYARHTNVEEISILVEEFLTWKAGQIRNTDERKAEEDLIINKFETFSKILENLNKDKFT